ncbi:MAG: hypothetical protein WBI04_11320 [Trichlorobacter sp.]|jgi:hypothetical protein
MKRRLLVAIDKAPILCYKLLQDLLQTTYDIGRIANTKITYYQAFTCTPNLYATDGQSPVTPGYPTYQTEKGPHAGPFFFL